MAKKAAWEKVRESLPGSEPIAQKKFNDLWKANEDEFEAEASVQLLNQAAAGDFSEDSYDIVIEENGGPLPGIKNYSEWLRRSNQKRPAKPEDKPGLIDRGVSAVKKAVGIGDAEAEEAPAGTEPVTPGAETYTPEQESLIGQYQQDPRYQNRTREEIIGALKKAGQI